MPCRRYLYAPLTHLMELRDADEPIDVERFGMIVSRDYVSSFPEYRSTFALRRVCLILRDIMLMLLLYLSLSSSHAYSLSLVQSRILTLCSDIYDNLQLNSHHVR